jgi:hypothetical protein
VSQLNEEEAEIEKVTIINAMDYNDLKYFKSTMDVNGKESLI